MLLSIIDGTAKQKINKEIEALNITTSPSDQQIYTEHSIQQQQNAHFCQVHMEHSPGYVRPQNTKTIK